MCSAHLSELHCRYVAYDLKFFVQDVRMNLDGSFCLGLVRFWPHNGYSIHILFRCRLMFKSVSMRKPGRTRQEVIQLKSPILLKLGINVGFCE